MEVSKGRLSEMFLSRQEVPKTGGARGAARSTSSGLRGGRGHHCEYHRPPGVGLDITTLVPKTKTLKDLIDRACPKAWSAHMCTPDDSPLSTIEHSWQRSGRPSAGSLGRVLRIVTTGSVKSSHDTDQRPHGHSRRSFRPIRLGLISPGRPRNIQVRPGEAVSKLF